jgi:diguanylate cyclase (GGDEF)-like protein
MNRVLLADDDPVLIRLLQNTLRKWGCEVTTCSTGESAWQVLEEPDAPRLMILDWGLPDIEGPELCRRIRQQENASYAYIILLTGKTAHGDLIRGMESGADDYLTKPCDMAELQVRVRAGQRIIDLQSRLLEAQEELRRQATHDALTEIWNRRAILDILQREVERSRRDGQPLGVIMADVDRFKSINDTRGHPAGDRVLHDVAQNIKASLRTYDSVGRYGGEEFLIVLPRCPANSATEIAERVRHSIESQPIPIEAASLDVTMSLGVASSESGGEGEVTLLQNNGQKLIAAADEALYKAKQDGRNRVVLAH